MCDNIYGEIVMYLNKQRLLCLIGIEFPYSIRNYYSREEALNLMENFGKYYFIYD